MSSFDLRKNLFLIVSADSFITLKSGSSVKLDPGNLHHIRKVLRTVGEPIINVSSGNGKVIVCKLTTTDFLEKASEKIYNFARPVRVSLMNPGIKRKNLELLIQKATEIGVDSMYFISSTYQNFPVESTDKYMKITENACIQSKNPWLPDLKKIKSGLMDYDYKQDTLYVWGDPDQTSGIEEITQQDIKPYSEVCFINGCEGGWSPAETDFLKNRFRSVRLSDNVLRAETAAIVAASYIKLLIRNFITIE